MMMMIISKKDRTHKHVALSSAISILDYREHLTQDLQTYVCNSIMQWYVMYVLMYHNPMNMQSVIKNMCDKYCIEFFYYSSYQ